MMRTSLRAGWRTIGHNDLGLRLRRALAHDFVFDTSSIFHRTPAGGGKHEVPSSSCHPKLSAVHASPIPARFAGFLRSMDPLPVGKVLVLPATLLARTDHFDMDFRQRDDVS